jgi:uncharacterized membrane protein/thiol-disulfide isomerase/thioredoxin
VKRRLSHQLALLASCLVLLLTVFPTTAFAQDSDPVVRAVLFFSPTCGHCEYVINNHLYPLSQEYGSQLEILGVDVSQPALLVLYQNAIEAYEIPAERLGVPTLIVGDVVMVGDREIPERFPGLIEQYLAQGGVDWPDIPGLQDALPPPAPEDPPEATAVPTAEAPAPAPQVSPSEAAPEPPPTPTGIPGFSLSEGHSGNWRDRFALDPVGNTVSVVVLVGMLVAALWALVYLLRADPGAAAKQVSWLIPALCLVGLVVAGYLAFVETTNTDAVCGPVGDCNTVQQSEYARLFGILPIGMLGLVGYIFIFLAWIVARFGSGGEVDLAALSLLGMTMVGTLFSIYLTFLEPFVIGATCAWCLTSAVLMTLLMLWSLPPGKQAITRVLRGDVY